MNTISELQAVCPDRGATLEEIEQFAATGGVAVFPVAGDCLEGAGVEDGGYVAVDFSRFPRPPQKGGPRDLCLCWAVFPGQKIPGLMCKEYVGVWGPWQLIGTRYDNTAETFRMNCAFEAKRIFGVIFASWGPDGVLKWERDREEIPRELSATPTIRGGNCGDPIPMKGSGHE